MELTQHERTTSESPVVKTTKERIASFYTKYLRAAPIADDVVAMVDKVAPKIASKHTEAVARIAKVVEGSTAVADLVAGVVAGGVGVKLGIKGAQEISAKRKLGSTNAYTSDITPERNILFGVVGVGTSAAFLGGRPFTRGVDAAAKIVNAMLLRRQVFVGTSL